MRSCSTWWLGVFGAALFAAATTASADILAERLTNAVDSPLYATHAPGDPDRLFIVNQGSSGASTIQIFNRNTDTLNGSPFLNFSGLGSAFEKGVLGLAFHPDYETNGKFYVSVSETTGGASGSTVVREYTVSGNPDIANTAFTRVIRVDEPFPNHNGGWIDFGPDGYLYLATGDGGSGYDPNNNGQTKSVLLGKMLRIDVDGDDFVGEIDDPDDDKNYAIPADNAFAQDAAFAPEIWAYGLRNPWRPSFDRVTGDLWIADVGQDQREEVNFQPADAEAGANYGWRLQEGLIPTPGVGGPAPADYVPPIYDYIHPGGAQRSITGGYRYRGLDVPEFFGKYLFADFQTSQIWTLHFDELGNTVVEEITNAITESAGNINSISSFGEDSEGEMYVTDLGGEVFLFGSDTNPADFNHDGVVDLLDYDVLSGNFGKDTGVVFEHGDTDNSGTVDFEDFVRLALNFGDTSETLAPPVPEPAGVGLLVLSAWWLMRRRDARSA